MNKRELLLYLAPFPDDTPIVSPDLLDLHASYDATLGRPLVILADSEPTYASRLLDGMSEGGAL